MTDAPIAAQPKMADTYSGVERRLAALPLSAFTVIASVGVLVVVAGDTMTLGFIPLVGPMEKTYGMTSTQASWALSVAAIFGAASIPLLSRLGDIFGMRRMLLISLGAVVVADVLGALATGPAMFIVARALIGFNATPSIFYAVLRLRSETSGEVDKAAGLMTGANGVGIIGSFLLGGVVLQAGGSVRTVLWIMTILSVLALGLAWMFIPESNVRARVPIDQLGAVLLGLGLALFVVALGQGNAWGWRDARTIGLLVGSVVVLLAWVAWESRSANPLMNLRIIRRREMWPAFLASAVAATLGVGSCLTASNYLQTPALFGYGFSASVLTAGLYLVPVGFFIAFGGFVVTPIIRKIGQRPTAVAGGLLSAAVFFWFAENHTQTWQYIVEMLLFGLAYALTFTAAVSAYLRAARPGEGGMLTGAAAGFLSMSGAFAPAIVTALVTASFIPKTPVPEPGNYDRVWLFFGILGLIVTVLSLLIRNSQIDQRLAENAELVTVRRASPTDPA